MQWWKSNTKTNGELPSFIKDGIYWLHHKLVRVAGFLQKRTNGYSLKKKMLMLLLFLATFISVSISLVIKSITTAGSTPVDITRLKAVSFQLEGKRAAIITKEEFFKILNFKTYVDSLSATDEGRKLRDSLLSHRPHLMDSVNFLVTLYSERFKTGKNERGKTNGF